MGQEMEKFLKLYESNHNSQFTNSLWIKKVLKIILNELLSYFYSQNWNEERRSLWFNAQWSLRKKKEKEKILTVLLPKSMMHSHFVLYLVLIAFHQKWYTGRKETVQRNFGTKLIGRGNKLSQPKQGIIKCNNEFNSPICIYSRCRITWGWYYFILSNQKWVLPKEIKSTIKNYPDCQWI